MSSCKPWLILGVAIILQNLANPEGSIQFVERFDSDPLLHSVTDWIAEDNRTQPHDFGWSDTRIARGQARGELGGLYHRESFAYYVKLIEPISPREHILSLEYTFCAYHENDGNTLIGWMDTTSFHRWFPIDMIGIRTENSVYLVTTVFANGIPVSNVFINRMHPVYRGKIKMTFDPIEKYFSVTVTDDHDYKIEFKKELEPFEIKAFKELNCVGFASVPDIGEWWYHYYIDDLVYLDIPVEPAESNADNCWIFYE